MKKTMLVATILIATYAISTASVISQQETIEPVQQNDQTHPKKEKSIDWFQLILSIGYLGGVFVAFPLVLYTNIKEKIQQPDSLSPVTQQLSEELRNQKTAEILAAIDEKLTIITNDDGQEWITITNGRQAKFVKFGLDYINKHLQPTDETLVNRVKEFEEVYNERTKRIFTGSKWVLGCAIGLGVLFFFLGGISAFFFIHLLGIIFYFLASRTPIYVIEKRMKYFGTTPGLINTIITTLLVAEGTKYYVKHGSGPWQRDYETELSNSMATLLILFVVAMLIGFCIALLGLLNAIANYFSSYILPTENEEKWYFKNFNPALA